MQADGIVLDQSIETWRHVHWNFVRQCTLTKKEVMQDEKFEKCTHESLMTNLANLKIGSHKTVNPSTSAKTVA